MTTDDAGEVSSGQAQKAILCHTEEASQQRRANGVYQVGEYWGDYSGCIWGISWAEDMLITEVQENTNCGLNTSSGGGRKMQTHWRGH